MTDTNTTTPAVSDICPLSCWCRHTDLSDLPWPAARWTPPTETDLETETR